MDSQTRHRTIREQIQDEDLLELEAFSFQDSIKSFTDKAQQAAHTIEQREADLAQRELAAGMHDIAWKDPKTGKIVGRSRGYKAAGAHSPTQDLRQRAYDGAFWQYLARGESGTKAAALKTLQEQGSDQAGGFAVPVDVLERIAARMGALSSVGNLVTTIPITSDRATAPKFVRDVTATDDVYPTAMRMVISQGSGEIPASALAIQATPGVGAAKLSTYTMLMSLPVSRDLLEDTGTLAAELVERVAETGAIFREQLCLTGTGLGQPAGILANPGGADSSTSVQTVNSGSSSGVTWLGLVSLAGALPAAYWNSAVWVMNPDTLRALASLEDASNRPILIAAGHELSLFGRPIVLSQHLPAVAGGATPIIFGDLAGEWWFERRAISIQSLTEIYVEQNQTLLLARMRGTAACVEPWRLRAMVIHS